MRVAKFVKSNAIVYANNNMTIGVGAGQMSRINSARIAAIKAEVEDGVKFLEEVMGTTFGSNENPLLLSVRSGRSTRAPSRQRRFRRRDTSARRSG